MKKLILVTALAVAASWLLSEPGQPGEEQATRVEIQRLRKTATDHLLGEIVLDNGMTVQAPLAEPPSPPEPPRSPGSMPTVRWRSALKRSTPASTVLYGKSDKAIPSWFPKSESDEEAKARVDSFGSRVLLGRLSASEDRARRDLRTIVEREVASWLAADIPTSWKVPAPVLDGMVQGSYTQEVTKSLVPTAPDDGTTEEPKVDGLYTLYRAGQKLDFSPSRRAEIVGMYRRDLAAGRMQRLGGGLALALVGLAVLSGYIKADEATKGYYTNRLRLAAAAGLGAAGVAAYRILA